MILITQIKMKVKIIPQRPDVALRPRRLEISVGPLSQSGRLVMISNKMHLASSTNGRASEVYRSNVRGRIWDWKSFGFLTSFGICQVSDKMIREYGLKSEYCVEPILAILSADNEQASRIIEDLRKKPQRYSSVPQQVYARLQ